MKLFSFSDKTSENDGNVNVGEKRILDLPKSPHYPPLKKQRNSIRILDDELKLYEFHET